MREEGKRLEFTGMVECAMTSSPGWGGKGCLPVGAGRLPLQAPSPDVKAGNSWHKESWLLPGGVAGFLAVGAVLPAAGVGHGVHFRRD